MNSEYPAEGKGLHKATANKKAMHWTHHTLLVKLSYSLDAVFMILKAFQPAPAVFSPGGTPPVQLHTLLSPAANPSQKPQTPAPLQYDGDPGLCRGFLTQCLVFSFSSAAIIL